MREENLLNLDIISGYSKSELIFYCNSVVDSWRNGNIEAKKEFEDMLQLLFRANRVTAINLLNYALAAWPRDPVLVELARSHENEIYNPIFFEEMAPNKKSAEKILAYLKSYFCFNSICDFGCGAGSWVSAAMMLGVSKDEAYGIDYYYDGSSDFPIVKDDILNVSIGRKFDLAICMEVAEHIPPNQSDRLIGQLTKTSDVVLFSAAALWQSGSAHINCRRSSFWASIFSTYGFECLDFFRPVFWEDTDIKPCYRQNTFLYVKKDTIDIEAFPIKVLHDIEHPATLNEHYLNQHRSKGQFVRLIRSAPER